MRLLAIALVLFPLVAQGALTKDQKKILDVLNNHEQHSAAEVLAAVAKGQQEQSAEFRTAFGKSLEIVATHYSTPVKEGEKTAGREGGHRGIISLGGKISGDGYR